jgi:quinol monooxygenase YgiN
MAITVVVSAKLRGDAKAMKKLHDEVTTATKEMAKAAGDLSHVTYLDPTDPKAFLGIDVWKSVEEFQAFAGNPKIQEFFGQMFEGQPEVKVWTESGWNKW